jgi:hypothetical protein
VLEVANREKFFRPFAIGIEFILQLHTYIAPLRNVLAGNIIPVFLKTTMCSEVELKFAIGLLSWGEIISHSEHRGRIGSLLMSRNVPHGQAVAFGRFSLSERQSEFENRMEANRVQGNPPGARAREMIFSHREVS